jgi:glucose 1-dehydrogenase
MTGKVALVTGAARGQGAAEARLFCREGGRVVLADVRDAEGEEMAGTLRNAGHEATYRHLDVSSAADWDAAIRDVEAELGPLDVLVNNAGIIGRSTPLLELAETDFDRVMAVNVKSGFLTTQAAARRMTPRGSGAIVNLASMAAIMASGDQIPYAVSKAAMKHLTAMTALALAPHGVRVNAVGPGAIETQMAADTVTGTPEGLKRVLSRVPMGRMGRPEEIAAIVAFLASDDASYLTGQTLFADGGRMALGYFVEPPEDAPLANGR